MYITSKAIRSPLTLQIRRNSKLTGRHARSDHCTSPRYRTPTGLRQGRIRTGTTSATACTPQLVFNTVTLAVMPLYGLMVAFPRKQLTKSVVSSPLLYTAASLLYLAALVAWGSDGLFNSIWTAAKQALADQQVTAFAALFRSPEVTALTWTHLLLLDLCVARHVYLDGIRKQVVTAHSVILCFMFGPTGLLSHMFTSRLSAGRAQTKVQTI